MISQKYLHGLLYCLIVVCATCLSWPTLFSEPCWTDGGRYCFNGILVHDWLQSGQLSDPYEFAVKFYTHYPVFCLPYASQLLALIFAGFYWLFGISFFTSHFIILLFTIAAGIVCLTITRSFFQKLSVAIFATTMMLFNRLSIRYMQDITPEMPIIFFSFLIVFCFWKYVEENKNGYGILTAIFFALAYLTKPYITPLAITCVVYFIFSKRWNLLKKQETWWAVLLAGLVCIPSTWLAVSYASNETSRFVSLSVILQNVLLSYHNFTGRILDVFPHLPVVFILGTLGFIWGIMLRNKLIVFMLLWNICWFFFFCLVIVIIDTKYFLSLIPAYLISGAFFLEHILSKLSHSKKLIALLLFFSYHLFQPFQATAFYNYGYEELGKYATQLNPPVQSMLHYADYDSTFLFGVRKNIKKPFYFLRGDRFLAVRVTYGDFQNNVIAKSYQDIFDILDRYSVNYVVSQNDSWILRDFPEFHLLNQCISENPQRFTLIHRTKIRTNYFYAPDRPPEISIYHYKSNKPPVETSEIPIPIPTLQKTITVPFQSK